MPRKNVLETINIEAILDNTLRLDSRFFKDKFVEIYFMEEIIFLVEESIEGGYTAKGLGVSIFTQAETVEALKAAVVDAVHCHFEDTKKRIIRLHIVREVVIAA